MPKKSKYPRLRVHIRRGASGQVWTSYWYDMRPDGKPDVALGTDRDEALRKWDELRHHKQRIAGTAAEGFDSWEKNALPLYNNAETRKSYAKHLRFLRPVFAEATWEEVKVHHLVSYLQSRSAKTQGNREMAVFSIVWNHARKLGLTALPWPAHGMERSGWKNKEKARRFEVTDELFEAVYFEADQALRDAMDLATATGMRVTDCCEILLPKDGILRLDASKTGKEAAFEIRLSEVLPQLVERRRQIKADHLMLISTEDGKPLTPTRLAYRFEKARTRARVRPENAMLAIQIKAMFLRDMRKRAGDLAGSAAEASTLLQHSSVSLTRKHYITRDHIKPAR